MNTRVLILFNRRVDRLDRSALAKRMATPHYQLDYERMVKREWISAEGITEDDVDAFALNARLLMQDGDGISIRDLAKNVYSDSAIPEVIRMQFAESRKRWHDYKNASSIFKHPDKKRSFRNGELFDVLLYGGIAHVNPNKVDLFHRLTMQGAYSSFLFGWFVVTLGEFLDVVRLIRESNIALLQHLQSSQTA